VNVRISNARASGRPTKAPRHGEACQSSRRWTPAPSSTSSNSNASLGGPACVFLNLIVKVGVMVQEQRATDSSGRWLYWEESGAMSFLRGWSWSSHAYVNELEAVHRQDCCNIRHSPQSLESNVKNQPQRNAVQGGWIDFVIPRNLDHWVVAKNPRPASCCEQ
jgi:hypothetical protein